MKHEDIFIEQWMTDSVKIVSFPNELNGRHDKQRRDEKENMSRLKKALSTISKVEIGKTLLEIIRINVLRRGKIRLVTYRS